MGGCSRVMPEGPRKTEESPARETGSNLCIPRRVIIVYFFVTCKEKKPRCFCNILHLRRRQQTPLGIIFLVKLIFIRLVRKLKVFCGILRLMTVFRRGSQTSLSSLKWMNCKIYFNIILPFLVVLRTGLFSSVIRLISFTFLRYSSLLHDVAKSLSSSL
jgi:hypothetical protein